MKGLTAILLISVPMFFACAALADTPQPFRVGSGDTVPSASRGGGGGGAFWIDPPNPVGSCISSECIPAIGLETEVANDFVMGPGPIILVRWWGGYWGAPVVNTGFVLNFYDDNGAGTPNCLPNAGKPPILEQYIIPPPANEVHIGNDQFGNPLYQYEDALIPPPQLLIPGSTYWFGVHMIDHPPGFQWGRLTAMNVLANQSVLWGPFFGFQAWTPLAAILGQPEDVSQEFHGPGALPVRRTSWGSIRGLYR